MTSEKRVALVIGNSNYVSASPLNNPINDARDIAGALTRIGFSGIAADRSSGSTKGAIPVSPFLDLNYDDLRRTIANFARAADNADQAILYYAGHGIEVEGNNYLIPIDGELRHVRDVEFETVSLNQVLSAVDGGSGLRLIILDACRDNPFRQRLLTTRTFSRGLRAVEPSSNILVAYAAKHGTSAFDGDGENSPYALALLNHLEVPGLEILDFFREVKDSVLEATAHRQEPYLYGSLGRRREYFVAPPANALPARPIDDRTVEHTYWTGVQNSEDPSDFEEFLIKFATGQYASLAKRKAENLIKNAQNKDLLQTFLENHPHSPRLNLVQIQLELIAKLAPKEEPRTLELRRRDTRVPSSESKNNVETVTLLVGAFFGLCSSLLCGVMWRITPPVFHEGTIFGVVLVIGVFSLGLRSPSKLIFVLSCSTISWWAVCFIVKCLAQPFWETLPVSLIGILAGSVGAALIAFAVQWNSDAHLDFRGLGLTTIIGGCAGSCLSLDLNSATAVLQSSSGLFTLRRPPWFCFLAWQVSVLPAVLYGLRSRMLASRR
jgi:hypothetical protein